MKRNHFSTFFSAARLLVVCGLIAAWAVAVEAAYLGPKVVISSPDGKRLYVANADAKQIAEVDVAGGKVVRSIDVPAEPTGMVFSPDGATLYVTCAAPEGAVCPIDVKSGKVGPQIPAGHYAIGPAISPDGKKLYVCNRFDNDVSVIDLAAAAEIARVAVAREPVAAAVTPDGRSVLVANHLPVGRADSLFVTSAVTIIDTRTLRSTAISGFGVRSFGSGPRKYRTIRSTRPMPSS